VPLSVYLRSADAVRAFPGFGYFPQDFSLVVGDLGAGEFSGLRCRKILVTTLATGRPLHRSEYWLAEDRNLIPARHISYNFRDSSNLPTAETTVNAWTEIRPGVWFPAEVYTARFDGDLLRNENRQVVSWERTYMVTRVSLDPQVTPETFTKIDIPPGTKITIEKDGARTTILQPDPSAVSAGEEPVMQPDSSPNAVDPSPAR
jgi:hypothetical protein